MIDTIENELTMDENIVRLSKMIVKECSVLLESDIDMYFKTIVTRKENLFFVDVSLVLLKNETKESLEDLFKRFSDGTEHEEYSWKKKFEEDELRVFLKELLTLINTVHVYLIINSNKDVVNYIKKLRIGSKLELCSLWDETFEIVFGIDCDEIEKPFYVESKNTNGDELAVYLTDLFHEKLSSLNSNHSSDISFWSQTLSEEELFEFLGLLELSRFRINTEFHWN